MFQSIICWTWISIRQMCKWVEASRISRKHAEMTPDYGMNCILKGTVDFYCLVCETYLRSEADNFDHIARPIHKKNLDITQYVKDFEEDFVRKIKQGYFCELCNKLLPTMARVKLHVKELSHNDRAKDMFFRRIGLNVIAFGKVVLNDKAWNGLNDESCAFCNTEYENEEIHKSLNSHILNIIQIKVEVDENKNMYRKIDDHSFQCLTCNMVLALNNISSHFEDEQHKLLYQKCCVVVVNKINNESLASEDLKEIHFKNEIEDLSDHTNYFAKPMNETEINTEQVHTTKGSDVKTNDETSAFDATVPFNQVGENEKKSKTSIGFVVEEGFENLNDNSKLYVTNTSNETAEDIVDVLKNSDVNKNDKNLKDGRVKKSDTEQKLPQINETKKFGTSNLNSKITRIKSSFNVEEYEKKICKILRTDDYITLDERGNTLCILCDWIMDPKNKKNHITGQHHQTIEKLHKRRLAKMRYNDSKENIVVQNKSIIDSVNKFQADNININLISNTAVCKKCTISLPYDVNAIEEHILKHNNETDENNVTLQSGEAIDKETCKNMNEANIEDNHKRNALENQNEEKVECVEDKNEYDKPTSKQGQVDENMNINETSLKDESKELMNKPSQTPTLFKQSLGSYIKSLINIKDMMFNDVIINDQICISLTSFEYLYSTTGDITCLACDAEVNDIETHIHTFKHINLLRETLVIINNSEFTREIVPEVWHCGFCNVISFRTSWSMQEHLNSSFHLENKNASEWRLKMYLDRINAKNYDTTSSNHELSIRNMFSGLF